MPEEKTSSGLYGARGNIRGREADSPTIRLGPLRQTNQWPSSLIPHFYAGCPSCRNPPNLSWLGTGTKYAGLHTDRWIKMKQVLFFVRTDENWVIIQALLWVKMHKNSVKYNNDVAMCYCRVFYVCFDRRRLSWPDRILASLCLVITIVVYLRYQQIHLVSTDWWSTLSGSMRRWV